MSNKLTRLAAAVAVSGIALLATAVPAGAHITIQEGEQQPGAFTVLTFGIPHGCEDSPTTKIEIQVPETILNVTPTRHPFYDVDVEIVDLDEPVTGPHGEEITTRDAVVVYTATTPLPDGFRDAVELSLQIPEDAGGSTLFFPTVQTCEVGETGWIEIPEDGQDPFELDHPAPFVTVADGSGDGGHGAATDDADTGDQEAADADQVAVDASPIADDDGDDDDGTDPVAVIALIVGALGLAVGAGGFMTARRKA